MAQKAKAALEDAQKKQAGSAGEEDKEWLSGLTASGSGPKTGIMTSTRMKGVTHTPTSALEISQAAEIKELKAKLDACEKRESLLVEQLARAGKHSATELLKSVKANFASHWDDQGSNSCLALGWVVLTFGIEGKMRNWPLEMSCPLNLRFARPAKIDSDVLIGSLDDFFDGNPLEVAGLMRTYTYGRNDTNRHRDMILCQAFGIIRLIVTLFYADTSMITIKGLEYLLRTFRGCHRTLAAILPKGQKIHLSPLFDPLKWTRTWDSYDRGLARFKDVNPTRAIPAFLDWILFLYISEDLLPHMAEYTCIALGDNEDDEGCDEDVEMVDGPDEEIYDASDDGEVGV